MSGLKSAIGPDLDVRDRRSELHSLGLHRFMITALQDQHILLAHGLTLSSQLPSVPMPLLEHTLGGLLPSDVVGCQRCFSSIPYIW